MLPERERASNDRFTNGAAVDPKGGWDEDWAAVWVDTGAGQPLEKDHVLTAKRAEVDQLVLANLLRLNEERSG